MISFGGTGEMDCTVHYWKCDPPDGPVSRAECIWCHAVVEFRNYFTRDETRPKVANSITYPSTRYSREKMGGRSSLVKLMASQFAVAGGGDLSNDNIAKVVENAR